MIVGPPVEESPRRVLAGEGKAKLVRKSEETKSLLRSLRLKVEDQA